MNSLRLPLLIALSLQVTLFSGCSDFFSPALESQLTRSSLNFPQTLYDIQLEGLEDPVAKAVAEESAQLIRLKDKPPVSTNALRYRAREDMGRIQQALIAHGYLESEAHFSIKHQPDKKLVVVNVKTGPRYKITSLSVDAHEEENELTLSDSKLERVLNIKAGDDVDYAKAIEGALRLQRYYQNHGYPFVAVEEPEILVDHEKKEVFYYFNISLKGQKYFGPVNVFGQKNLSEAYIRNRISWQPNEPYDERLVEKTKRKLIESDLFSGVYIKPIQEITGAPTQHVPMALEVKEGPPRVIGGGLKYSITDGFSVRTYWQHKNYWGDGQRMGLTGQYGEKESFAQATYDIPDLWAANFDLLTKIRAKHEITEAYRGSTYYGTAKFRHQYCDQFSYYLGGDYEYSNLTREGDRFKRNFWGIPMGIIVDTSNDPLNPIKGEKLELEIVPYYGNFDDDNKMLRLRARAIHYLRLIKKDVFIIASWVRAGAIYFARGSEIPLNKRFYSGGAGSVRGYGYQLLGPIDNDRKPEGGRGLIEFGLEPRIRFTEKFGMSAFFEGGRVTKNNTPTSNSEKFLYGVGIGAKYYTEIGPFRIDCAVPLKRRTVRGKKVDAPFQVYLSIGQAF